MGAGAAGVAAVEHYTMNTTFPALYLSHGAPTLVLSANPAHRFLAGLGSELGRPEAIVMISAHWDTPAVRVTTAERHETIHDFYGFPESLYRLRYPAPGAPALAAEIIDRLQAAEFPVAGDDSRGLDHGAWVPLMLMYPDADVPVVQVSLQSRLGPTHHLRLGEALAPLRDRGVLVIGSGSATHNLREFVGQPEDSPPPAYVRAFADWLAETLAHGTTEDLLAYRAQAPAAERNHPTEEHFLPLFAARGAAGNEPVRQLHRSYCFGILAMDNYAFGGSG